MDYDKMMNTINSIREKGYNEGIIISDYVILKKMEDDLKYNFTEDANKVKIELRYLIDSIFDSGLLDKISRENSEYIRRRAYILPLALANNRGAKYKIAGSNRYMFLCQFHMEFNPSMSVKDIANFFYCFGCHHGGNVIDYLMKVENLSYADACNLLAQIYKFRIDNPNKRISRLAAKYRRAIKSEEYLNLLDLGEKKLTEQGVHNIDGMDIEEAYYERRKTIERIRNYMFDPDFKYDKPLEVIHFEKEKEERQKVLTMEMASINFQDDELPF